MAIRRRNIHRLTTALPTSVLAVALLILAIRTWPSAEVHSDAGRSSSIQSTSVEREAPQPPRRLDPALQQATALQKLPEEVPPPSSEVQLNEPFEEITVPTPRRGAQAVTQVVYSAVARRAKWLNDAAQGRAVLQVFATDKHEDKLACAISPDAGNQKVRISAPANHLHQVQKLLQTIDRHEGQPGTTLRLIDTRANPTRLAQHLENVVPQLVAQAPENRQIPPPPDQQPNNNQPNNNQPENPNEPPVEPGVEPQVGPQPILRLEGLRGPVMINDVPGLGLVVTGSRGDVDAVLQIIEELERVATGPAPDIHLVLLQHVGSEALAALLNNVYESMAELRTGGGNRVTARILPVVRPNAIMILGSQGDIQAIRDLAIQLDQPLDPRDHFRVYRIRHAVASQIATTIDAMYGQQAGGQGQGQGQNNAGQNTLLPRVRALADPRTNSLIVQGSPRELDEVAELIARLDRADSASVNKMRVFPLKNALADELAEVIQGALSSILSPLPTTGQGGFGGGGGQGGGGQGAGATGQSAQQLREAKSVVLEFLSAEGPASPIRSGILADIRVTADPRVNSLIVTAPAQSLPLMEELIRQLDRPSPTVAEIKVFPLTNTDATSMLELLEVLFESNEDQPGGGGIQVVGADDANAGLVPLRFSVDTRTNTVIAIGAAESLQVVEAILLRLDQDDVRQRRSVVVKLKNSPVVDVANAINQFLQSQRDLAQIDPNLVSTIELLEREVIAVPEPVSNSLLISATPRYYDEIIRIVETLDAAPAQVMIQVLIVEVELQNTDEFGVELGFQDPILFDRSLLNLETFQTISQTVSNPGTGIATTTETIVNEERLPGFLFNNNQLGNAVVNPSSVGSQGLSSFSLGRVNGDLGFGGLVLGASSEAVSVLIRALSAHRTVHILSRPQIRTLDNQLAQIQVGQQVPVIAGATTNNFGGITPVLGQPQQVGIILQVTPRIRPDNSIVMETIANKSAISGQGIPILTDPTTGTVVESPIFDLTEARATVAVPDGQTIVLGGMITKADDTIERKVPWLGDIPILGTCFRYDGTTTRRTELLIFMTPRVVHSDADSELIKQIEVERTHFLEKEAEQIHGPIFSVPAGGPNGPYGMNGECPPGMEMLPGEMPAEGWNQPENVPAPSEGKTEKKKRTAFRWLTPWRK